MILDMSEKKMKPFDIIIMDLNMPILNGMMAT
jgi:CheY-like chemotaxis protein